MELLRLEGKVLPGSEILLFTIARTGVVFEIASGDIDRLHIF